MGERALNPLQVTYFSPGSSERYSCATLYSPAGFCRVGPKAKQVPDFLKGESEVLRSPNKKNAMNVLLTVFSVPRS